MKKVLFVLSMLIMAVAVNAGTKIILSYEDEPVTPYSLGSGITVPADKPGLTVDMLKIVGKNLGLDIEFKRLPWKRCLKNLASGTVDGAFQASFKEKRKAFGQYPNKDGKIDPSRQVATMSYYLYKKKGTNVTWDGKTLFTDGKQVGAVLGFSIVSDLEKLGVVVDQGKSTELNLKKVLKNRMPATCELSTEADFKINANKEAFKDIVKMEPPIKVKPYYLMLSHQFIKKNPKLAEKIWDEIKKVVNSPEYTEIKAKYGL